MRNSLITAAVIEAILALLAFLALFIGGAHPGGAIFVFLHQPSSIVVGRAASYFGEDSLLLEVASMALVIVGQFALIALLIYGALSAITSLRGAKK